MAALEEILLFTLAITLVSTLIARRLVNRDELRAVKDEIKMYRQKSAEARKAGDAQKANAYMKDIMRASQKQFRLNIKPSIISLILFVVALGFLREAYSGILFPLPVALPLLGQTTVFGGIPFVTVAVRDTIGWFWWYLLIAIPSTFIFRKLAGLQ